MVSTMTAPVANKYAGELHANSASLGLLIFTDKLTDRKQPLCQAGTKPNSNKAFWVVVSIMGKRENR